MYMPLCHSGFLSQLSPYFLCFDSGQMLCLENLIGASVNWHVELVHFSRLIVPMETGKLFREARNGSTSRICSLLSHLSLRHPKDGHRDPWSPDVVFRTGRSSSSLRTSRKSSTGTFITAAFVWSIAPRVIAGRRPLNPGKPEMKFSSGCVAVSQLRLVASACGQLAGPLSSLVLFFSVVSSSLTAISSFSYFQTCSRVSRRDHPSRFFQRSCLELWRLMTFWRADCGGFGFFSFAKHEMP